MKINKSLVYFHFVFLLLLLISGSTSYGDDFATSSDGVEISYQIYGKGYPALVFIHGWCCDKSYWKYQVAYFSKDNMVVIIDLAGHGESGLGRKTWSMEAFGEDVLAVLENLNIERAILIGHSMGGAVIIETARQIPKRIMGLVGVDTYHNIEFKMSKEGLEKFIKPFKENFSGKSDSFIRNMFTPDADSALVEQIVNDMSSAPSEVGIGALQEYFNYDRVSALNKFKIRIICINSDRSKTIVESGQRHAISFELKLMPGIGHFVMMEEPENFNKLLTEAVIELSR